MRLFNLKRSVYTLYVLIVLSILVITSVYYNYMESTTLNVMSNDMKHINVLMANSMQRLVTRNEPIMKILGTQILHSDPNLTNKAHIQQLLEQLVVRSGAIKAIGIATPDGQLQVVTGVSLDTPLPNFHNMKPALNTFNESLNSNKITVGRTYFVSFLYDGEGAWVIPVRLKVEHNGRPTEDHGKVEIIVAFGLDVRSSKSIWANANLSEDTNTYVVREDGYLQYTNDKTLKRDIVYNTKFLGDLTKLPLNQLFETNDLITDENVLAWISFNEDQKNYTIITISKNKLILLQNKELKFLSSIAFGLLLFASITFGVVLFYTQKYEKQLVHQADFDDLTGLPNRAHLHKEISMRIKRAKETNTEVGLFFIDLDDFKQVNDTYNHFVGDKLLIEVSRRFTRTLRKDDFVARLGGDEFVVLTSNHDNRRRKDLKIDDIAKQIHRATTEMISVEDIELYSNSSIGIATYPKHARSTSGLLRKADLAMYKSKKEGKNKHCEYTTDIEIHTIREYEMKSELRNALENNEFYVLFQPQVHYISETHLVGFEALVRWENKKFPTVGPSEFIPILEQLHLIDQLSDFVIEESIREFAEYKKRMVCVGFHNHCKLSINVSALQFNDQTLISFLSEVMLKYGIHPGEIEIEITETSLANQFAESKIVNELHVLGVSIAIDDFGTGYSSLQKLNNLSIDTIKIDKQFIDGIGYDSKSESVIETIIMLGQALKTTIIAEGVENHNQRKFLNNLNSDIIIQGYLFSKPVKLQKMKVPFKIPKETFPALHKT